MWVHEHTGETTASREAVWKVLSNIDEWASWDTSMDWVRLQGPFRVGSKVRGLLYENAGFGGASFAALTDLAFIGTAWNDRTGSIKVLVR